jgi:hypothetical protein
LGFSEEIFRSILVGVKVEYPITGQSPSATTRVVRDQTLLNPKPDMGSIMG